jgi:hypothetical protein
VTSGKTVWFFKSIDVVFIVVSGRLDVIKSPKPTNQIVGFERT